MEMNQAIEGDDINIYQINERKLWEQRYIPFTWAAIMLSDFVCSCVCSLYSSHPYIFFNQDSTSLTFVGFTITPNGDLFNPRSQEVLEQAIMTPSLYTGLNQNGVNFQDDCQHWKKSEMISKLAMVMGVEYVYDPDDTYVLTVDNMIKILAIHMRFRYVYCSP